MRYLFHNNRPPQESEQTVTTKIASITDYGSRTSIKKTMTRFLLLLFYKDTDNRQVQQQRRQRRRRRTRGRQEQQKHPTRHQQEVNNDCRIRQSIPKLIYIVPIQTSGLHGMNTTVDRTFSNKMHNNYALNNHQHVKSTGSK